MLRVAAIAATVTVSLGLLFTGPAMGQNNPIPSHDEPMWVDSGTHRNTTNQAVIVWSQTIAAADAEWVRLNFNTANLAADTRTGASSILRIMSMHDGAVQVLDATSIQEWSLTSAYFNGNAVTLELVAAPRSGPSRVIVDLVTAGDPAGDVVYPTSICGPTDDRILSTDPRACRLVPIGCSAWIFNDNNRTMGSAGHCSPNGTSVCEFNVPLSNQNGTIVHPPPEDQYSVQAASVQAVNGGVGNDWSYFACFKNSITGLTPFMAQADAYVMATVLPPNQGQTIRITGYGTVSNPVDPRWNQVQKTHTGPYLGASGGNVVQLQYQVDTTGGNSGSPVIHENSGQVIGVHTHGGCSGTSGNSGTGITLASWQNARGNPRGMCARMSLGGGPLNAGQNTTFTTTGGLANEQVYFLYSLQGLQDTVNMIYGVVIGIRNPVLAGSAIANGSGSATLTRRIPPSGRGRDIWIQAAAVGQASTIFAGHIN